MFLVSFMRIFKIAWKFPLVKYFANKVTREISAFSVALVCSKN